MINAIVQNKQGETAVIALPSDRFSIYDELRSIDLRISPDRLKLTDEDDDPVSVKLYSDSDIGNQLILLFNERHTLTDVNNLDTAVTNAREEIKEELEQNILYGQYQSIDDVYEDIWELTVSAAPVRLSFFCPLSANINGLDGDMESADNSYILEYQEEIQKLLLDEQQPEDGDMAEFLVGDDSELYKRLFLAEWKVEEIRGELYGRIDCYLTEQLSDNEIDLVREALIGQASDGFGEHLEQQPIHTDDGEMYIIDWAHATCGNASADAARTYLKFWLDGEITSAEKYLKAFCEKSETDLKYVKKWMPIVAAAQLFKGNEKEREFLKSWINVVDYE